MRPTNLLDVPFVPSAPWLGDIELSGTVIDLGCGDGTALSYFKGCKLVGIEGNPELVKQARERLPEAEIVEQNFWDADVSKADIVYIYWQNTTIQGFKEIFWPQLKKGARVISFGYEIPGLKGEQVGQLYVYKK